MLHIPTVAGLWLGGTETRQRKQDKWAAGTRKGRLSLHTPLFIADGFFHADLHPGNIFFTEDGKIVLLDFGMYGELSDVHRDHFILYWYAGLQRQLKRAFYHLIKQTTRLKHADEEAYFETFKKLAERFYNSTIAERSLTQTYLAIIYEWCEIWFCVPKRFTLAGEGTDDSRSTRVDLNARSEV